MTNTTLRPPVYRIAQELSGAVDQVVITKGEGGYRYAALAERIYGTALADESAARLRLPEIRRRETLAAGRILGIRDHYFLNQRDRSFTLDAGEPLGRAWNCTAVCRQLRELMERERYDFVFTVLPRNSEHGHHQAATLLALNAAVRLDAAARPVVLSAEPTADVGPAGGFAGLDGFVQSRPASSEPDFVFDRRRTFGHGDALSHEIVVRWMIAEHKSQGMFQNHVGRHSLECFWRFANGPADAAERTRWLANQLLRSPRELANAARQ
jgi:N-acetylglucosamine malate deacetylase 2